MNKNEDIDRFYSFKCGLCSFLATYISGVMHPFDLIKTRFQSTSTLIKATMVSPMRKT